MPKSSSLVLIGWKTTSASVDILLQRLGRSLFLQRRRLGQSCPMHLLEEMSTLLLLWRILSPFQFQLPATHVVRQLFFQPWKKLPKNLLSSVRICETSAQDFGSGFGHSRSQAWGMPHHRLAQEESRTGLCSTVDYGTRCFVLYTLSTGPFWCHKLSKIPKSESRYFYPSPFTLLWSGPSPYRIWMLFWGRQMRGEWEISRKGLPSLWYILHPDLALRNGEG